MGMTNDKTNFSLRLNPYVHKMVTERSKKLGVSKNSLITMLLNEQLEKTQVKGEKKNE